MKYFALASLLFAATSALAYDDDYTSPGYKTSEEEARIDRQQAADLRQEEEDTYTDTEDRDHDHRYGVDSQNLSGGGSGASATKSED